MKVVLAVLAAFTLASLAGCSHASGEKQNMQQHERQGVTISFDEIYSRSCSGCHGADGENGAATDLANPYYQALVDDKTLHDVIANGQTGTMMPSFADQPAGGLTAQQIDGLIQGMRQRWSRGDVLGADAPHYKATLAGNVERGRDYYATDCARCHGPENGPAGKAGSILNNSFLALITDQTVRTTAIAGRPDLGMPNFRERNKDRAVTDQNITDVVAFVMAHRSPEPGEPYPPKQSAPHATANQGKR